MPPAEVRERLLAAAVGLVREHGLPGLTQPRVAKAAGVSQSHLTYYFPTRAELLRAVLERAVAGQRAGIDETLAAAGEGGAALAAMLAETMSRPENTRVLVSFVLAADKDPVARALFAELAGGMRATVAAMLARIGIAPRPETIVMVHALGTGLAILSLALGGASARSDAEASLAELFRILSESQPTRQPAGEA